MEELGITGIVHIMAYHIPSKSRVDISDVAETVNQGWGFIQSKGQNLSDWSVQAVTKHPRTGNTLHIRSYSK